MVVNATNDASESLLRQYDDQRIKLYCTKEKLGAGGAREKAFELAVGEYIAVVDCDDYVGKDYIMNMVKAIGVEEKTDIVFAGFHGVDIEGNMEYTRNFKDTTSALYQSVAPWAKMYRRDFLISGRLEFANIPFGEDIVFTAGVIMAKPTMRLSESAEYFWEDNPNSTSHGEVRFFPEGNLDVAFSKFDDYITYFQPEEGIASYLIYKYVMWYLLQSGRNVGRKKMRAEYTRAKDYICGRYPNWESNCLKIMRTSFGERKLVVVVLKNLIVLRKVKFCAKFLEIYSCLPMDRFWPSL